MTDKQHLEAMLTALDASPRALERIGDWQIVGNNGHIMTRWPGFRVLRLDQRITAPLDRHQKASDSVGGDGLCSGLVPTIIAHRIGGAAEGSKVD